MKWLPYLQEIWGGLCNMASDMTDEARQPRKFVYLEEYDRCACTQIEARKMDLLGYCSKHFTDRKRVTRIPDIGEKGWVGNG